MPPKVEVPIQVESNVRTGSARAEKPFLALKNDRNDELNCNSSLTSVLESATAGTLIDLNWVIPGVQKKTACVSKHNQQ